MGRNGGFFSRMGHSIKTGAQRFMRGRYGTDKLNTLLLGIGLILCLVSMFMPLLWLVRLLGILSYVFMAIAIFRCLSRNTYKRYQENRRYLALVSRMKDKTHRYYKCPKCRQTVRVPKGKGKIAITCPKCKERFVKKT